MSVLANRQGDTQVTLAETSDLPTISVGLYSGANFGAKLQAAHDAAPSTGAVLDCRNLTGAQEISTVVTISKKCEIILGASTITCTTGTSGAIKFVFGSRGSILRGSGYQSSFTAAGGVAPILWIHGDDGVSGSLADITIERVSTTYSSSNAGNRGILVDNFAERFTINECTVDGHSQTGYGIYIDASLIGVVSRCHIQEFDYGIYMNKSDVGLTANPNANILRENVINNCNEGMVFTLAFDGWLYGNTVQDNVTCDIRFVSGGSIMSSGGNHYESTATGTNVIIDGGTSWSFVGDYFSASANGLNVVHNVAASEVTLVGCTCQNGVTANNATSLIRLVMTYLAGASAGAGTIVYDEHVGSPSALKFRKTGSASTQYNMTGFSKYTFDSDIEIGTAEATVTSAARELGIFGTTDVVQQWRETGSNVEGFIYVDTLKVYFGAATSNALVLRTNNTNRIEIGASTGSVTYTPIAAGHAVFNENGVDADFRIEGDTATNLFFCDAGLDAVQIGTTTAGVIADFRSAAIVFNEDGSDRDFRVEGDTNTHALFVDASVDRVGVCNSTPSYPLHVTGIIAASSDVYVSDSAKGIVLKDTAGTPHYWRVTVSTLGVLTTADLGTSPP